MKKYHYEYTEPETTLPSLADGVLFLDIETTGFSRTSTYLTIIGLAWKEGNITIIEQWFNDQGRQEELLLLIELEHFLKQHPSLSTIVHYNGTTFDLPYLMAKYDQYHLPTSLPLCSCTDLYQLAKKYKDFLGLTGLKQKNLEEYFGLYRKDSLSGQELIQAYLEGIETGEENLLASYLLHNKEDMEGMVFLQHLLQLDAFFNGNFHNINWNTSPGYLREQDSTISVTLSGDYFLKNPIRHSYLGIDFHMASDIMELSIPVKHMEAKYFYPNYKDYYYLPSEDCAMHKSVAQYVEKEYRKKATKETCYTKKATGFLPLPLPTSPRLKKEFLSCCCLNLFYENYGDSMAWIDGELNSEKDRYDYLYLLLKTILSL